MFVLEKCFCTGINTVVLEKIFLYCNKYVCTVINMFVME